MLKLKHLFESVWFGHRHLTKKMYTAGLVLFSGTVAVAIVMLGVNGFVGTKHADKVIAYDHEDEEVVEVQETEVITTDELADESEIMIDSDEIALAAVDNESIMANDSNEKETINEETTNEETTNMIRDDQLEETDKRTFRTQVNNIEESDVKLLSMKDYTALVRIVEAEATDEDLEGKILIANVVMNRVDSDGFPDTIYDVVHEKINGRAQFSPIDDGRFYKVTITDSTIKAVEQALSGVDDSQGALFFVAKSIASETASSWFDDKLDYLFTHGVHSFYKY